MTGRGRVRTLELTGRTYGGAFLALAVASALAFALGMATGRELAEVGPVTGEVVALDPGRSGPPAGTPALSPPGLPSSVEPRKDPVAVHEPDPPVASPPADAAEPVETAKVADPEPVKAPEVFRPARSEPASKPEPRPKPKPKPEPRPKPKAESPKPKPVAKAPEPAPRPKVSLTVSAEPAARPSRPSSRDLLREPRGSGYAVQVASVTDRKRAEGVARDLEAKGWPAYLTRFEHQGRTYFRVRVGHFDGRDDARRTAAELEAREGLSDVAVMPDR